MHMQDYVTHPNGFISERHENSPKDFEPDMVVETFDKIMKGNVKLHNTPYYSYAHFIREIIERMQDTTDWDLVRFFKVNLNHLPKGHHRDFLLSTIKFIQYGKRDVGIDAWKTLIAISEPDHYTTSTEADVIRFIEDSADEISLANWIAQPNGLRDLVHTMVILFGPKIKSDIT